MSPPPGEIRLAILPCDLSHSVGGAVAAVAAARELRRVRATRPGVHAMESGALCHSRQKCDVLVISLLARLDACIVRQSLARVPFFRGASKVTEESLCGVLAGSFPPAAAPPAPSRPFGVFGVMCPSPCRVTLHVAWPVSGLGGPFGPFFLYSDYYVLVTVYVILGRDPRRWGLRFLTECTVL